MAVALVVDPPSPGPGAVVAVASSPAAVVADSASPAASSAASASADAVDGSAIGLRWIELAVDQADKEVPIFCPKDTASIKHYNKTPWSLCILPVCLALDAVPSNDAPASTSHTRCADNEPRMTKRKGMRARGAFRNVLDMSRLLGYEPGLLF